MSFRPDAQAGYFDRFGHKHPQVTAHNVPANGRLTDDTPAGPNRSDLTCQGCGGHEIHALARPLFAWLPRHSTNLKQLKKRIGTEVRAYCLGCGRNWEIKDR